MLNDLKLWVVFCVLMLNTTASILKHPRKETSHFVLGNFVLKILDNSLVG